MGTPQFSARVLERILAASHTVCAVVTRPDRPKGRSRKPIPSPVKQTALDAELDVLEPAERASDDSFVRSAADFGPDIVAVAAYGEILGSNFLSMPPRGCVNLHASLLPAYRGAAPVPAAIAHGETETGLTTQLMDEGMDTGDILLQKRIDIGPDETAGELLDRMAHIGGDLLVETLDAIEAGTVTPVPQDHDRATYCKMLRKSDGLIDWARSAREIHNHVRAMNPWPVSFTRLRDQTVRVWATQVLHSPGTARAQPGTVLAVDRPGITVATGDGTILITELQAQGSKRMSAHAFTLGHRLSPQARFTTD